MHGLKVIYTKFSQKKNKEKNE